MQEKLNKAHHKARTKIYNAKLKKLGNKVGLIHITTEHINLYRDTKMKPEAMGTITCYLNIPQDEVELFGNDGHGSAGINIYDVLPKYLWTDFRNDLSENDIVLRQIYLDETNFILQLFQIKKKLIKAKTYLHQVRYQIAPLNTVAGVTGDNQMELALASLVELYKTEPLPEEDTAIDVPDPDEGFDTDTSWYNLG